MAVPAIITRVEMTHFLQAQGFQEIQLSGTRELVLARCVRLRPDAEPLSLRVYTSVEGLESRAKDADAIRVVLAAKIDGEVKVVGCDRRVHRVRGWRQNLQDRLDGWRDQIGPVCNKCGSFTVRRRSKRGPFWGCARYPVCVSIQPIVAAAAR